MNLTVRYEIAISVAKKLKIFITGNFVQYLKEGGNMLST